MVKQVRVVILQEVGYWVAQCLEYDICVQADNLEQIFLRLEAVFSLENKEKNGIKRLGKAPDYFFNLWDKKSSEMIPSKEFYNASFVYGMVA